MHSKGGSKLHEGCQVGCWCAGSSSSSGVARLLAAGAYVCTQCVKHTSFWLKTEAGSHHSVQPAGDRMPLWQVACRDPPCALMLLLLHSVLLLWAPAPCRASCASRALAAAADPWWRRLLRLSPGEWAQPYP